MKNESATHRVRASVALWSRTVAAGTLAGLLLAATDLQRFAPREPEDFEALAFVLRRLLALGLLAGVALGTVLALPALLLAGSRTGRGSWPRALLGLGFLGLALVLDRVDARCELGAHDRAHQLCAGAAFLAATLGWERLLALTRARAALVLVGLPILIGLFALAAARGEEPASGSRSLIHRQLLQGPRVLAIWEALGWQAPAAGLEFHGDGDFAAFRRSAGNRALALRAELDRQLGAGRPRHLVWITVMGLRRDALSCLGGPEGATPRLDRLAGHSLLLARHWAPIPDAALSLESTFHGRYPSATPLHRRRQALPDDPAGNRGLAPRLSAAGFHTIGLVAASAAELAGPEAEVLRAGFTDLLPADRVGAGADRIEDLTAILDRLPEAAPVFIWLQLDDPARALAATAGPDETPAARRERYRGGVAEADRKLGALLDLLERRGLRDDGLVLVDADQGAILDRGPEATLGESGLAIPGLIHLPGGRVARHDQPSGNVDLLPTVFDLLGLAPDPVAQGQSLAGLLLPEPVAAVLPRPFAYAEIPAGATAAPGGGDLQAIRVGDYELIVDGRRGFDQLYDLAVDPGEELDLAGRRPDLVARLGAMIRVLRQESSLINVPEDQRSTETYYRALRDELSAGPVPTRCWLLAAKMASRDQQLRPILAERLADPSEHELIKLTILRQGLDWLGAELLPAMRALLADARAIGTAATLLELWRQRALPLEAGDRDLVAAALGRHPQIAWRAARLLADHGDRRGEPVLRAALAMTDDRLRFETACALAALGDRDQAPLLRVGLVTAAADPELGAEAIRRLAALGDREAFPLVVQVVTNQDLASQVQVAALDYFRSVGDDLGRCGLAALAGSGADLDQDLRDRIRDGLGADCAESLVAAGRARIGQADEPEAALARTRAAATSLGSITAAALEHLTEAELLLAAGRGSEAAARLEALVGTTSLPGTWRALAEALADQGLAAPPRLEVRELAPVAPGPGRVGREALVRVRLANVGAGVVPGGPGSIGFRLRERSAAEEALGPFRPLPAPGLAPGGELELLLPFLPSAAAVETTLELAAEPATVELLDGRPGPSTYLIADAGGPGLDPTALDFGPAALRAAWTANAAFRPGVELPGPLLGYLAADLDPYLVSPLLADRGRALEVELRLAVEAGDPAAETDLELFWRYPGQDQFLPQQSRSCRLRQDGALRTLTFRIEASKGEGPVQLRLDPFQEPELVVIESLKVRVAD
ncbi:MAG: sulfatase-like hydrolase/transferase [Planctomycetes bacterium]|nr:sulfatase-like hydrolase/transferase [Planctomycetota bacterium]